MGSIPVATVKYADCVIVDGRKSLVESYEAALIIELARVSLVIFPESWGDFITLSSGLEAMMAMN